jgi:hypothetical protein
MGGTAYLIHGTLDPARAWPVPRKRSLLDKLLGRQQYDTPSYVESTESTIVDVPPGELEPALIRAFRQFLEREIASPWEATSIFYSYLDFGMHVYLRGQRPDGTSKVDWFVQLDYSGCAGMAEISAELGYHWVHLWLERALIEITSSVFEPRGFMPNGLSQAVGDPVTFLPLGECGYALYYTRSTREHEPIFALDDSVLEAFDDDEVDLLLRTITNKWSTLMADGQCRCQLCMPGFDATLTSMSAGLTEQ